MIINKNQCLNIIWNIQTYMHVLYIYIYNYNIIICNVYLTHFEIIHWGPKIQKISGPSILSRLLTFGVFGAFAGFFCTFAIFAWCAWELVITQELRVLTKPPCSSFSSHTRSFGRFSLWTLHRALVCFFWGGEGSVVQCLLRWTFKTLVCWNDETRIQR